MSNEAVKFKLIKYGVLKKGKIHPYLKIPCTVYRVLKMEINPHLKKFLTKKRSTLLQKAKIIHNT